MHSVHENQDVTPEMSRRLVTDAEAARKAVEKRNKTILDAHNDGEPLRAIAIKVGMSWSGVRKIINQEKGATP